MRHTLHCQVAGSPALCARAACVTRRYGLPAGASKWCYRLPTGASQCCYGLPAGASQWCYRLPTGASQCCYGLPAGASQWCYGGQSVLLWITGRGQSVGAGVRHRYGLPAGAGVRHRYGLPAGAGVRHRYGLPAGAGVRHSYGLPAGAGVRHSYGLQAGAGVRHSYGLQAGGSQGTCGDRWCTQLPSSCPALFITCPTSASLDLPLVVFSCRVHWSSSLAFTSPAHVVFTGPARIIIAFTGPAHWSRS